MYPKGLEVQPERRLRWQFRRGRLWCVSHFAILHFFFFQMRYNPETGVGKEVDAFLNVKRILFLNRDPRVSGRHREMQLRTLLPLGLQVRRRSWLSRLHRWNRLSHPLPQWHLLSTLPVWLRQGSKFHHSWTTTYLLQKKDFSDVRLWSCRCALNQAGSAMLTMIVEITRMRNLRHVLISSAQWVSGQRIVLCSVKSAPKIF